MQIFGRPCPPRALLPLRAGPLHLLYDPENGMLRRLKLGKRELLRGVYAAVRNENWETVPGMIKQTAATVAPDSFQIEFTSEHKQAEIDFFWHGIIEGTGAGEIRYNFSGQARSDFRRNRIGFCLLHPIAECAGVRARQTRADGRIISCRFPDLIEPQIVGQSPFQQLSGIAHEVSPQLWFEASFTGDVFEMEDQRNWSDASFKTYCTPLNLPFPAEIARGTQIHQCINLRLIGAVPNPILIESPIHSAEREVTVTVPEKPLARLPKIGLGTASSEAPLSPAEISKLRQLQLSHLRVDVHVAAADHCRRLQQAIVEAEALGIKLELAIHQPRQAEPQVNQLVNLLLKHKNTVDRILALREAEPATSAETLTWVRHNFAALEVPIGAGSDCNFCELRREQAMDRLAIVDADFLFWSVCPQVHATDHLSVIETLETYPAMARTARAFAQNRPLIITPITLKQRFNPVATTSEFETLNGELAVPADARQFSDFAAAWTMAGIAALAKAEVESATYYETVGPRGILNRATQPTQSARFSSSTNREFPVYDLLHTLSRFELISSFDATDFEVITLGLFNSNELKRVLIANLSDRPKKIRLRHLGKNAGAFAIGPYEIRRTDVVGNNLQAFADG